METTDNSNPTEFVNVEIGGEAVAVGQKNT
jgi:hypothetical protein